MQLIPMLLSGLIGMVVVSATLAVVARCLNWGLSGWLAHRREAERVRAARYDAQSRIEAARARERAAVALATARGRQADLAARTQVAIAREKALAQERMAIAVAELKAGAQRVEAESRAEVARLELVRAKISVAPSLAVPPAPPAVPAPLPELLPWHELAERVRPGYFVYGLRADGQLVQKPITEAYHTLLHGETRSGKTTAIHSLVVQAHVLARRTPVRLYMTDVKRELSAAWGRSPLLAGSVVNDAAGAAELIVELVDGPDGVLERYRQFESLANARNILCANLRDYERHHPEGIAARPPLVFVVIDELNALLETSRRSDDLQRGLTILLQTGAAAGFYVIAGAQYLSARVLGRDATQQFVSRAHFGAYDQTALRMLFNQAPERDGALHVPPGRGYIRVQGQPAAMPFQGVYCDEATILDVQRRPLLRQHGPLRQPEGHMRGREGTASPAERAAALMAERVSAPVAVAVESVPASTSRQAASAAVEGASNASQGPTSTSTRPPVDPEKADRVRFLRSAEGGRKRKSEILAEVWGVTGGRRFATASVEYEAIVAATEAGIA